MADSPLVRLDRRGAVAVLTLDNPPANTYSYAMMQALDARILELRMDSSVHVVVVTGRGDRFFCAGADIAMLDGADPTFKYAFCLHANETLLRMEHTPKLFIAALNGHTVGGGLEVAMACDLRIGRRNAGKVGLPEVHLGVLPGTGGTQRLTRLVGKARAIELMIEGRTMSMDDAADAGLMNRVIDADSGDAFLDAVVTYAETFCPPGRASKAVAHIKRACQSGADLTLEAGLALERELQQRLFESADAKEGITAYIEKRPAVFEGK